MDIINGGVRVAGIRSGRDDDTDGWYGPDQPVLVSSVQFLWVVLPRCWHVTLRVGIHPVLVRGCEAAVARGRQVRLAKQQKNKSRRNQVHMPGLDARAFARPPGGAWES